MPRTPHISKPTLNDLERFRKNAYNTTLRAKGAERNAARTTLRALDTILLALNPTRRFASGPHARRKPTRNKPAKR